MTQRLQITNCKTSRIGEIVVMKQITDINTTNGPPTNQVNRRSETQAPASCGPTPLIKSKPDQETPSVTLIFMWGKMWGKILHNQENESLSMT